MPISVPNSGSEPEVERDQDQDQDPEQNRAFYTAHGRFAGQVAAAIDIRAGFAPAATCNLVPFVNAPLFGDVDLHTPYRVLNFATELPPRLYADKLVGIYWQYVDPMEPILDRVRFFRDYDAYYAKPGAPLGTDRDICLSIFNIVFALAVQRQEFLAMEKRDDEANRYFQHAWALLRPEVVLWQPGSLELVQCLMLMNRYLHCTNNQQQTWMTAGLAIRIAQSICCHLPESTSSNTETLQDQQLRHKVWRSCVALDRCVSWSLGRTSAPPLNPIPGRAGLTSATEYNDQKSKHSQEVSRELELFEIGSQIQIAQTQTRNAVAAKLGLPRLYQQDEYHAVAVQLDTSLNTWESNLPTDWQLQNLHMVGDRAIRAERYLLHLRLLHNRIFLCRPLLARYYSMRTQSPTSPTRQTPCGLSDRLLKECAVLCVEAAQKVASLVQETLEPNEPFGLLPWWCRVYYLHIAGVNFLAAMFSPDLYTESVSQSWQSVLASLRSHQHLSIYVQHCMRTFETLSARILQTRNPKADEGGNVSTEEDACNFFMEELVPPDVTFDFDNFLFGTEDFIDLQRY